MKMFYKVVNNLIDTKCNQYLTPSTARIRSAHSKKYIQYHSRTNKLMNSFFPGTVPVGNSFHAKVPEASSLASFN